MDAALAEDITQQVFKKLKEKYPDSVPYSARGNLSFMQLFFKDYGMEINEAPDWQYKDGKIIHALFQLFSFLPSVQMNELKTKLCKSHTSYIAYSSF